MIPSLLFTCNFPPKWLIYFHIWFFCHMIHLFPNMIFFMNHVYCTFFHMIPLYSREKNVPTWFLHFHIWVLHLMHLLLYHIFVVTYIISHMWKTRELHAIFFPHKWVFWNDKLMYDFFSEHFRPTTLPVTLNLM